MYPTRAIRYVVASAPGGIADTSARVLGPSLAKALGQPVVVENRTSGGIIVGADAVAKAAPDGHTLLSVTPQLAIVPSLHRHLPFDARKDLAPIALLGIIPNVLVVGPKTPANTVQELVELARRNPGKLNYSSTGQGTSVHLTAELLKYYAGISIVHVPYRGASAAMNGLLAGDVDLTVESMLPLTPHLRAGKVRPLAVASAQRIPQLPDVPTLIESGYPNLEMSGWIALMATGGTPPAVVARLEAETKRALETEAGPLLEKSGVTVRYLGAADFAAYFAAEMEKFALAVRASGVVIQ